MAETSTPTTTLSSTVSDLLKKNGVSAIEEQVAETLFKREIDKRSDAVVKVMDLIDQEKKNLKKIDRPDIVTYSRDGKPTGEGSFSKGRLDEINKISSKIKKLEGAINKALSQNEYGDLYQAAQGKLKDDDTGGSDKSAGGDEGQS